MSKYRAGLSVFVASLLVAVAQASTIATVEGQASGTAATLDQSPVVSAILSQPGTVNGRTYTSWSAAVNDGTGSMFVFGTLPGSYTPTVGDAISASGTYSPFHQIPELGTVTAISATSSGNAVPAPLGVTIPQINQATLPLSVAGYMLSLHNVTISGISGTFDGTNLTGTITDAGSNSMTLFYWPTSYSVANANLTGMTIPTTPVDMLGIVSVFNSTPEFTPISITPEPASVLLLLAGLALRRY